MQRLITTLCAMTLAFTMWTPNIAVAQTVWSWSDLSNQLTTRTNRPIWAMAYANSSWTYTDGQDLWNGGQVYRFDGTTQVTVTTDVRNANLSRVDDIVSDGQSVLFLQDVVRRDNSFSILKWNGSTYSNLTSNVRNVFASDEGIRSIVGRNGTWYIVTTKNHLLRWNGGTDSPVRITLPSNTNAPSITSNLYQTNHVGFSGNTEISIVPVANNGWLVTAPGTNSTYQSPVTNVYRYDGITFSNVSLSTSIVWFAASNGSQALLAYAGQGNCQTSQLVSTDGVSVSNVSFPSGYSGTNVCTDQCHSGFNNCSAMYDNKIQFENAVAAWDGTNWMIVANGKKIYQVNGTTLSVMDPARDYITTIAADTNGHFLLGGAVSDTGYSQPTSPLTAKLLWASEGGASTSNAVTTGGSFGGDRVYTSANGPRIVAQGDPSNFRVGNGKEFTYRVTATDPNGVDRTDMYINDARIKTCYSDVCEYRTTYWTNGASTKTVKFWVRSTDKRGESTDTAISPDYLTVDVNSSATAGGSVTTNPTTTNGSGSVSDSGSGITSWTWLDPNITTLNANQTVSFNVGAWDTDGLNKIEIYVNGSVRRTCNLSNATGNQTCNTTLYGSDYSVGTNAYVNAKLTDARNNVTWTNSVNLYRSNDTGSINQNNTTSNAYGIYTTTWLDPNVTTLTNSNSATFYVSANDSNGIQRIEIYLNGNVQRTCDLGNSTSNQQCSVTVYGSNYTQGTSIYLNARVTDGSGNSTWTNSTTITRNADSTTNTNTSNGTASAWSWFDPSANLNRSASTQFKAGAWAQDGLSQIDLVVNGNVKRICSFNRAYGNQECAVTIYGGDYSNGSLSANAKITDVNGKVTWSNLNYLTVTDSMVTSNPTNPSTNTSVQNGSLTTWTDHGTTFRASDKINITTSGSDPDGLNRTEIYVNSIKVQTCWNTASCSITVGPFADRGIVTYGATLFDQYGNVTDSGYKQLVLSN